MATTRMIQPVTDNKDKQRTYRALLGNGTVTVSLNEDLTLSLYDNTAGKIVKSIPKKNIDTKKYEEASADFSEMKKNVKKAAKSQVSATFEAFLSGKKYSAENWSAVFLRNPVLNMVARLLVWKQGSKTFTLTADGPIDSTGKAYSTTDKPITVAHPMEMKPTDVTAWQKYFASHGLKQPFAQVREPVIDSQTMKADRYKDCMIPFYHFKGQEKYGITVEDYDFHNQIDIYLESCEVDIERIDWRRDEILMEDHFEIQSFGFKKYTRQVNHIIAYLDRITIWDRIRKDDLSVSDQLDWVHTGSDR